MRAIRALMLSDDRPGHYHLAEGVVAALARRRPVSVVRRTVARRSWLPGRLAAALVGAPISPGLALRLAYGIDVARLPAVDVVVSAGGDTLAANAAAAAALGAVNIFCGSLRHLPPERYSLVISSYRRHAALPRHLVTLKPNPFDPDRLRQDADASTRPEPRRPGPPRIAGLLVGGDSGRFHYATDEWADLLGFLGRSHAELGTRWIVTTSRRTDPAVADALVALASAGDAIAELIDIRTAGPGTLPRVLARAEAILATEDSSSMISEAVTARLPVVGVAPRHHGFSDDEAEYRALMVERNWCRFMPLASLDPQAFATALGEITPLSGNHLDMLAEEIEARLPELFRSA